LIERPVGSPGIAGGGNHRSGPASPRRIRVGEPGGNVTDAIGCVGANPGPGAIRLIP
jgi:hypothetical protein